MGGSASKPANGRISRQQVGDQAERRPRARRQFSDTPPGDGDSVNPAVRNPATGCRGGSGDESLFVCDREPAYCGLAQACDCCYFVEADFGVGVDNDDDDDASSATVTAAATADDDDYDAEVDEIMRSFAALGGEPTRPFGVTTEKKNGKSPPLGCELTRAARVDQVAARGLRVYKAAASGANQPMCCLLVGESQVARFNDSCCCCACWPAAVDTSKADDQQRRLYLGQQAQRFLPNSKPGNSAAAAESTTTLRDGRRLISRQQFICIGASSADAKKAPSVCEGVAIAPEAAAGERLRRLAAARRTERMSRKLRPGAVFHKSGAIESSPASSGGCNKSNANDDDNEKSWTLLSEKVTGASSLIESAAAVREIGTSATAAAASCKDELTASGQCRQTQLQPTVVDSPPVTGQNNNNTNISQNQNRSNTSASTLASSKREQEQQAKGTSTTKDLTDPPPAPLEAKAHQVDAASNKSSDEASKSSSSVRDSIFDKKLEPSECDKAKAKLKASEDEERAAAAAAAKANYVDWNLITRKYRKMPRHPQSDKLCWQLQTSCFCRLFLGCLQTLFPILTSFRDYRLPGDLITDLVAGSTVAVLHIPQGMAYGLLAGVDPIYGLYVSFVPVIVMALMSKSRHVSYGTFAILSMLLANACELTKAALNQQHNLFPHQVESSHGGPEDPAAETVVVTNNHRMLMSSPLTVGGEQKTGDSSWFVSSMLEAGPNHPTASASASASVSGVASDAEQSFVMPSNIEILTCICILVGLIQIAMSILRLGILSLMFSDQLVSSFTAASAFHVITSQVPNLFDLPTPSVPNGLFKVCRSWWALTLRLSDGFNYYTAALSLTSILFLLVIKELVEPLIRRRLCKSLTCLPSELCLMACIILSSWYWKFEQTLGIEVIGHVPTSLPAPKPPRLDLISIVFQDALTIALVSFAMNLSLGQVYAKRNRYQLDPNQELFALGASNVVGSFFSCFPCASSLSRSAVQSSLNVKSQVCALFSCSIVVLIICYFAPILHDLPKSTLSCIIVVALKGILFQVRDFYENWRLSKLDAIVWITTFTSVLAFGVTYGLVLGIAASLFMVFVRLLNPNHSILGQLPGTEIYVDREAFIDCHEIEQVKIFRFNSALCYLNRTMFKACIEKSLPMIYKPKSLASFCASTKPPSDSNQHHNTNDKVKFLIIDCSALAYCDYSGAETLIDIVEELEESKVHVYLAACPAKLIDMIEKMKRTKVLEHNVHPTITDALNHARYLRGRHQMQQCSMSSGCNAENCTSPHSVITGLP